MWRDAGAAMELGATAMTFNPAHGKIDELTLAHKANRPVAKRHSVNPAFPLKGSTDLIEVLAIDKERAVFLPHALTVFHNRAVLHAIVLAGVLRTGIR